MSKAILLRTLVSSCNLTKTGAKRQLGGDEWGPFELAGHSLALLNLASRFHWALCENTHTSTRHSQVAD